MANKNNENMVAQVTKYNIYQYSTADAEFVLKNSKQTKNGYPLYWPTKDENGKKVVFSFVNARIYGRDGNPIDDEIANFDICETDKFDDKASDAATKIKFIVALLSPGVYVKGGVYYKGEYYVDKMMPTKALFLTQSFFDNYFALEDGELLLKSFKGDEKGNLPFWPSYSRSRKHHVVFSAVNAFIYDRATGQPLNKEPYNFDLYYSHQFDLNNPSDKRMIEVMEALLDPAHVVEGFYYKGKLIKRTLGKGFKLYLEKGFVKNNFVVEQKDYLNKQISKDPATGKPLFWPARNEKGRPVIISVIDANFPEYDAEYASFDVYNDELFDVSKVEFQKKLDIISGIFYKKPGYSGTLYIDSVLIPGVCKADEIFYRRTKAENRLNIYINRSDNFQRINNNHTIEDRENLINLCHLYDNCYPRTKIAVPKKDISVDEAPYFVKVDSINVVNNEGGYIFEKDAEFVVEAEDKISEEQKRTIIEIIKYASNKAYVVRGGFYYKGLNVLKKKSKFIDLFKGILSEADIHEIHEFASKDVPVYDKDKKTGMLLNWPVYDSQGRNVLLSVVESSVFFKVGRNIVKATVNGNFDIYEGETFGLVGESGSGKTTISRAILRINPLTKGGIYYKGRLISSKLNKQETMSMRKNIQMIFQDPAASLNERANIDYIVSEGLYNFHMFRTKEERLSKVERMLRSVGLLSEHMSRYPHEFSGGQRQRIGIARALVIEPQLVLADEPISALDVSIRAQVLNLLKKLQTEKKLTYLFIAHDLSIIRYISDRIAVMHQGHIVELGLAEEIYSNPLHPYTRSLLTAIPQPDPRTKEQRKKVPYVKGDLDYDKCRWVEFKNKHYVLVDDKLEQEILKNYK